MRYALRHTDEKEFADDQPVAETSPPAMTEAQRDALEALFEHGDGRVHAATARVLQRSGLVEPADDAWHLTTAGRNYLRREGDRRARDTRDLEARRALSSEDTELVERVEHWLLAHAPTPRRYAMRLAYTRHVLRCRLAGIKPAPSGAANATSDYEVIASVDAALRCVRVMLSERTLARQRGTILIVDYQASDAPHRSLAEDVASARRDDDVIDLATFAARRSNAHNDAPASRPPQLPA